MIVGVVPGRGSPDAAPAAPGVEGVVRIGGRPVIDYVVERMRRARDDEIRVVTRPEKRDAVAHALASGLSVVEARPPTRPRPSPRPWAGSRTTTSSSSAYPTRSGTREDGYLRLLAELERGSEPVLGLSETDEPERRDVVETDETGRVRSVERKPERTLSPSVWGCAVGRARILRGMDRDPQPGTHFRHLAREGKGRP